jgi:glycosyltransferase involved in cell wall biosynthesis
MFRMESPLSPPPDFQGEVYVVIPAFNEEGAIARVLDDIPQSWVKERVVVNNRSTDRTREVAQAAGATVLDESRMGYGFACLRGLSYLETNMTDADIVVFLDGDYSDHPGELPSLVMPIMKGEYDFVLGSRTLGKRESKSLTPQQIFGNWLATTLISLLFGVRYTDLGPFRAIRWGVLKDLQMEDKTYGWTVEMQLKAAKKKLRILEVPVSYRVRIGKSKVSGTVKGTVLAGIKILHWIFKYWLR